MSDRFQYRAADKGIYGPVTMDAPTGSSFTTHLFGTSEFQRQSKLWNEHLQTLPRAASVPSCGWKDGEIVEKGKDFRFGEYCEACNNLGGGIRHCAHPEECGQTEKIAVPISGGEVKEEETKPTDDGWLKLYEELRREMNLRDAITELVRQVKVEVLGMIDWKETNAPSVDAGKETFSLKDLHDFAKFYRDIWFYGKSLSKNPYEAVDEYLNQLNKQKWYS